jgi:hypothetical protein
MWQQRNHVGYILLRYPMWIDYTSNDTKWSIRNLHDTNVRLRLFTIWSARLLGGCYSSPDPE